jgi:hypothetical protein
MTQTQAFEALEFYTDHERFAETCYTIYNKEGLEVPFRSFQLGRRISKLMARVDAERRPGRGICLKPRQAFGSSHIASEYHRRTAFKPGKHTFVMAQLESSAENILNYYQQFDDSYVRNFALMQQGLIDAPMPIKLRRLGRQGSADKISYERGSWARVISAKSANSARGFSAAYIHGSEAAYYGDNWAPFLAGVLHTAPKLPGCWVWFESTANGTGNGFHQLWLEAISGNSEWNPVFVGTHEIEQYAMPLRVSRDQFLESYTKYERAITKEYGLTPEQIYWRRYVVATDCGGNADTFKQEYPYNWQEAFLSSGRKYFDMNLIAGQPCRPPAMTGNLDWSEETFT